MSSYLIIVGLDGVVADSTKRFDKARRADDSIDWKVAFDPVNVPLDTLIDGAKEAIEKLQGKGLVVFLTSRPEAMREATEAWLAQHRLDGIDLHMKPKDKQFTKTVKWKAEEVALLRDTASVPTIFIDDEAANRHECIDRFGVVCFASLAEATDESAMII